MHTAANSTEVITMPEVTLLSINKEKETATFKFDATSDVPWNSMAGEIFKKVGDAQYFINFFNLRLYDDEWSYDRYVVPVYTPFANIKKSVIVSDRYGRWEHELENPFAQYIKISRQYRTETYYKFRKETNTHDFEVNHTRLYKTAVYDIPAGIYEIPFEVVFGFASENVFLCQEKWVYHTRYKERSDRCGNQYNYPWQTFVPDEYKLPQWSYYESTAGQLQKATKLVADGNNINYPVVDYINYIVEVDPRTLEYDSDTDLHNNPYTRFHFWNEDVWVGIPTDLQKEEKIYVRFYMYNEVWAIGKETIGGDPLDIHAEVYTAEKYQRFLAEEPSKKEWVKY